MRADLNCKCHATRTDNFTSSCKDVMQEAPTVWATKKFLFFETRYLATVILRSVFVSVPFYNFPCFYYCVSIFKVRLKERLKNSAKTVQRSVFFPLPFFLTIVPSCLYLDKNFEIPRLLARISAVSNSSEISFVRFPRSRRIKIRRLV